MRGAVNTVAAVLLALLLAGCRTPTERADRWAHHAGFTRQVVDGQPYHHVVYRNARFGTSDTLHVYIEGDGAPYSARDTVAKDPTPHHPLALHLMAEDPAPAVWVGRPCYFGLLEDPACAPGAWSSARFSAEVVMSMATVIRDEIARAHASRVVLIGHSGGGALALLAAQHLAQVELIITVAGNLDTDAWTSLHGYTPLTGSLNPAQSDFHGGPFKMVHYAGGRDRNVPAAMIAAAAARLGGEVIVEPAFDHVCCWDRIWPEILRQRASHANRPSHSNR